MITISEFISKELEKRKKDYSSSPDYILEHYNTERANIESYNGRQLLEMIQNADDASAAAKTKKVYIKLENDSLSFPQVLLKENLRTYYFPNANLLNMFSCRA